MKATAATGRRKTSVAQVRLLPGSGKAFVNKRELKDYFDVDKHFETCIKPLRVLKDEGKYDIFVNVRGGGKSGQTGAIQLALSRALVKLNQENHQPLKDAGLLTRDPRMVERKKYGQKKARKRFQFSKR